MKYYHGTSSSLDVGFYLLPSIDTDVLREDFMSKLRDVVFVTSSVVSAEKYAKKAVERFGGDPVVMVVSPIGARRINNNEYVCDKAIVLKRL